MPQLMVTHHDDSIRETSSIVEIPLQEYLISRQSFVYICHQYREHVGGVHHQQTIRLTVGGMRTAFHHSCI